MVGTKKFVYFIVALILFILFELIFINHLNNKVLVDPNKIKKVVTIKKDKYIDKDSGFILEYVKTSEIKKDDIFIIRDKKITKVLKKEDVIDYFSISLYDKDNVKKRVKNSKITVYMPLNDDIKEYEEIKLVRLNSEAKITEDKFNIKIKDGYLIFDINMTSKYAIIGIKKK